MTEQDDLIARLARREARLCTLAADPYTTGSESSDADLMREARAALVAQQADMEGVRRFLAGEQVGVSTGICGSTTYGYGDLDKNGYWQYPVPPELAALKAQLRAAEARVDVARTLRRRIGDVISVLSRLSTPPKDQLAQLATLREWERMAIQLGWPTARATTDELARLAQKWRTYRQQSARPLKPTARYDELDEARDNALLDAFIADLDALRGEGRP